MVKNMNEKIYDSSIHHVADHAEGKKPQLWMRWTTLSGADLEVYTLEKVIITIKTKSDKDGEQYQHISMDGGAVQDQLASGDWIVNRVLQDRQRYGPQPGTQVFPDRIVYTSGIYTDIQFFEEGGEIK